LEPRLERDQNSLSIGTVVVGSWKAKRVEPVPSSKPSFSERAACVWSKRIFFYRKRDQDSSDIDSRNVSGRDLWPLNSPDLNPADYNVAYAADINQWR